MKTFELKCTPDFAADEAAVKLCVEGFVKEGGYSLISYEVGLAGDDFIQMKRTIQIKVE